MAGGSAGCPAALTSRRLTPEPISSSPGTARLPPSISSLTNFRDLDASAPNVRSGSLADKQLRAKIGLCPLWSKSGQTPNMLSAEEQPVRTRGCRPTADVSKSAESRE